MGRPRSVVELRAKDLLAEWFFDLPPGDLLERIVVELVSLEGWVFRDQREARGVVALFAGPRGGETVDDDGVPLHFPQFVVKVPSAPGSVDLENAAGDWGDELWDDAPGSSLPTDIWVVRALAVSPQGFVGRAQYEPSRIWGPEKLAEQVFRHREDDHGAAWLNDLAESFMVRARRAVDVTGGDSLGNHPEMKRTDRSILGPWLLEALDRLGGEGTMADISRQIWLLHEKDLRASGRLFYTWQYDLRWVAQGYKRIRVSRVGDTFVWRLGRGDPGPSFENGEPDVLF